MNATELYIHGLPENQRLMMEFLREIILGTSPKIREDFKYALQFYYANGPFCYLNKQKTNVYIAFYWGKLMPEFDSFFDISPRTMVKSITFSTLEMIEEKIPILQEILSSALLVDHNKYTKK
jgi:hypothetical protein